jgi:UMP-CMP kinase
LFGGDIPYWDTCDKNDSSHSFRVVFVLGGPGAGKGTQSALLLQHYGDDMIHHLSVGQLLRDEQEKPNSKVGATIRQALVSGQIVPVQISLSLIRLAMQRHVIDHNDNENKSNNNKRMQTIFLVDGFPRNDDNLSGWCRFMTPYFNENENDNTKNNDDTTTIPPFSSLWGVLVYHCPLQVLERRILQRSQDAGPDAERSDDNLKSIQKRFETFQQETMPIIEKLRQASTTLTLTKSAKSDDENNSCSSNWKVVDIRGDLPLDDVWLATKCVFDEYIQNDVLTANAALLQAIHEDSEQAYQELVEVIEHGDSSSSELCFDDEKKNMAMPGAASASACISILEQISNPTVEFVSGQKVTVAYNRPVVRTRRSDSNDKNDDSVVVMMRETRLWVHQGPVLGWRNVECSRTPI